MAINKAFGLLMTFVSWKTIDRSEDRLIARDYLGYSFGSAEEPKRILRKYENVDPRAGKSRLERIFLLP